MISVAQSWHAFSDEMHMLVRTHVVIVLGAEQIICCITLW